MENIVKLQSIDRMSTALLAMASPVDLGIPSWSLDEMMKRNTYCETANFIFDTGGNGISVVEEYLEKKGYSFSWGTVSEEIELVDYAEIMDDPSEEEVIEAKFEFSPSNLLKNFPNAGILQDLFEWMYSYHPLRDDIYGISDSTNYFGVLAFEAQGVEEIANLRNWLARIFIPEIFPDLLREAELIVFDEKLAEMARTNGRSFEGAFIYKRRDQLCKEPAYLSFYK